MLERESSQMYGPSCTGGYFNEAKKDVRTVAGYREDDVRCQITYKIQGPSVGYFRINTQTLE